MARIEPFEKYSKEYDEWFIKNQDIYSAELNAIKSMIPFNKSGVEIGVGTGRFALPLRIKVGVEPSKKMAEISKKKGITVYEGVAEQLPFNNETFDFVLFVTTICFVDDLVKSFREAYRVLKTDGFIIICFIDKESELGKRYQLKKKSKFYKDATFYSAENVIDFLRKTNFENFVIMQTVFPSRTGRIDSVEDGYGKGSFVIIKGIKKTNLEESYKW
jgi:ubiquinone/menaquinone biosynthesis C-methylase UbiE